MPFAKVHSAQPALLDAHIVDIEVDVAKGLHAFSVVGLPDKAIEEARDRMSAAIKNAGFKSPKQRTEKTIVSLAPADLKKEGPAFDLPMALAYLLAVKDIDFDPKGRIFVGELSLDGAVREIAGVLPIVREAQKRGFKEAYVPKGNAPEATIIEDITVYGISTLEEIIGHLHASGEKNKKGKRPLNRNQHAEEGNETEETLTVALTPASRTEIVFEPPTDILDFADIRGQATAKRGLLIAAAGGHNVAMYGPPGTGKTMLARAFAGILPPLSFEDILDTTSIHSVAGALRGALITSAPLRSPHHTASYVSMVGGGSTPKPGEVTLAHRGVLFLDEFPEFERRVIDALRQPLEDRIVSISRSKGSAIFPADFILIAAMNPCPCGNFGTKGKECTCSASALARYKAKLSGPIVDRIDLWLEVGPVDHKTLLGGEKRTSESETARSHVARARSVQEARAKKLGIKARTNSGLRAKDLDQALALEDTAKDHLDVCAGKLGLSARSYHRIAKLARTIADLEGSDSVTINHINEALQYRPKRLER
jgi:magnesium chelatase family protein